MQPETIIALAASALGSFVTLFLGVYALKHKADKTYVDRIEAEVIECRKENKEMRKEIVECREDRERQGEELARLRVFVIEAGLGKAQEAEEQKPKRKPR